MEEQSFGLLLLRLRFAIIHGWARHHRPSRFLRVDLRLPLEIGCIPLDIWETWPSPFLKNMIGMARFHA